jgi:O-antigen/teichoic acid export membrane protein
MMLTIIIGRVAQFMLALAMLRVATTMLSPEEMGKVSLIFTTIAFYAMFLVNPVGMFINRRIHAWQASGVGRYYLERYIGYLIGVAILATISLSIFKSSDFVNLGVATGWLIGFVCASIVFNTINQTAIPLLNMLGDSRQYTLLSVATLAASFLLAFLFVKTIEKTALYWVFGVLLGQAILAGIGSKRLLNMLKLQDVNNTSPILNVHHLKVLFSFAWPVAIAAVLGWVQLQAYRYIMENQLGVAQLGLFVAGYSISAGLIAGFESILTTYFQPRLYKDVNNGDAEVHKQAWNKYATVVIPSLLLTTALISLLSEELTGVLLGSKFKEAAIFVLWGSLVEAARVLSGVYSLIAHVHMRTRWLILPSSIAAMLSIILSMTMIPTFGAGGAGLALAVSGYIGVFMLHILLAKHVGGGISVSAIGKALLAAAALYLAAILVRYWVGAAEWLGNLSVIVLTGIVYLMLLFKLLHKHIISMGE